MTGVQTCALPILLLLVLLLMLVLSLLLLLVVVGCWLLVVGCWLDGELVEGPKEGRYFVECTFMWPKEQMPEPRGGMRLLEYGCKVQFAESRIAQVRKIKKPDDIRPGTKKGKIDHKDVWLVKIAMPKKLMHDIDRGYTELDRNKVEDILSQSGGVNAHIDPADQQAQEMANAPAEQAAPAA